MRDRAERQQIINYLRDECMDDEWYENSKIAYINSLSSIGKAEYVMQCLDRDIERWSHAIWAMNQRKLRDEQLMITIGERRLRAIQRQKLISDLETAGVSTNEAAMEMSRSHRLRDQREVENRSRVSYTQAARHQGRSGPQHHTGMSSSTIISTAPFYHDYTIPTPRLESGPRRQRGVAMSSSPHAHSQSQYSTPGSLLQPIPGRDSGEAGPIAQSVYASGRRGSEVASDIYHASHSGSVQHHDPSGGASR